MGAPEASPTRVLAVDDEEVILEVLQQGLRFAGFEVTTASDGAAALAALAHDPVDLVILDVMLPDVDGFEVCRRLRAAENWVPVIFLTARDADVDLIEGFSQGADDYVTKPFRLGEIVARVEAVLRRASLARAAAGPRPVDISSDAIVYADLVLDEDRHTVTRGGASISLSPTEFRLLTYLMLNAEIVLSRYQIIDRVWGIDGDLEGTNLATYISYLRKKLGEHGPDLIKTVYGLGYTLRAG